MSANWQYVGTTSSSNLPKVKERLHRHEIMFRVECNESQPFDGIYGDAYDIYVGESRYYEAENLMNAWEEEGVVIILTTAIAR